MNSRTHTPTPAHTQAPASPGSKTLWAATLVLVVVVLALGATLIRIQSQPIEPRMSVLPQPAQVAHASANRGAASASTTATGSMPEAPDAVSAAAAPTASAAVGATMTNPAVPGNSDVLEQNRPQALTDKAPIAIKNRANQAIEITGKPRPVLPRQPEPAVLRPPGVGASSTAIPEPR